MEKVIGGIRVSNLSHHSLVESLETGDNSFQLAFLKMIKIWSGKWGVYNIPVSISEDEYNVIGKWGVYNIPVSLSEDEYNVIGKWGVYNIPDSLSEDDYKVMRQLSDKQFSSNPFWTWL